VTTAAARSLVLPLLLTLAACSQPSPSAEVDTRYRVTGHVASPDAQVVPLGVSFLMLDDAIVYKFGLSDAVDALGFIEAFDAFYLTEIETLAEGAFEIAIPDGDDIPVGAMVGAADFVANTRQFVACTVEASDDDALVSVHTFAYGDEFVTLPGIVVFFFPGMAFSILTEEPVDMVNDVPSDHAFVTWVYADRAVDVTSGAGCGDVDHDIVIDVSLAAGWNQLSWTIVDGGLDPDTLILQNSDADEVYVMPAVL
jgi:hypothetical protein